MGKILTLEEINRRFEISFDQKVIATKYINRRSPINLKCLECEYEWSQPAASVLFNEHHKCPNCGIVQKIKVSCAYCGKELERSLSSIKNNKSGYFYCNQTCGNRHKNQLRAESGEWDNSFNYRSRAMNNLPHKCAVCGWKEDERILEVHHLNENRRNNELENLIILCPICHRKITLGYYKLIDNQLIMIK